LTRTRLLHKYLPAAPRGIESLPQKPVRAAADGSAVCDQAPNVNTAFMNRLVRVTRLTERAKYRSEVPQRTPPHGPPTDLDELSDLERDLIQPRCA
jgi:hypothetical protein